MELVQTQFDMEKMFAKNQLMSRIKKEFVDAGFEKFLVSKDVPVEFGLNLLVQMQVHKRASVAVLVGILHRHFEDQENPLQACADALLHAASNDVVDYKTIDQRFVVKYVISEDVQNEIDIYQYPLPMVVKPNEIKNNRTTGYMTIKGSVILKNNHHEDDLVLEHLNKVNGFKLCMNPKTVRMIQNKWSNLDKPKDDETFEEYKKRVRAFDKYDRTSRDVLDSLFTLGNEFYLTHKYDKRGRVYCQGYHCTYQGTDWNKAVIEFADKETVHG